MYVDHIAFVTSDLQAIAQSLPDSCIRFPVETHPAEGTKEQYIDPTGDGGPLLLLMQPIGAGPYQSALNKRGPGLHHIGATTPSIVAAMPHIEQHRLLLHPISLHTYANPTPTVWLCRPGVPFLVELWERDAPQTPGSPARLNAPAHWPIPDYIAGLFSNLMLGNADDDRFHLVIAQGEIVFSAAV